CAREYCTETACAGVFDYW
nr:immunoglobulin heavy chain junction region [Macaca mulatta]MOW82716.1 immunoglobulin heavy chain junction region [Macaca mulatta]